MFARVSRVVRPSSSFLRLPALSTPTPFSSSLFTSSSSSSSLLRPAVTFSYPVRSMGHHGHGPSWAPTTEFERLQRAAYAELQSAHQRGEAIDLNTIRKELLGLPPLPEQKGMPTAEEFDIIQSIIKDYNDKVAAEGESSEPVDPEWAAKCAKLNDGGDAPEHRDDDWVMETTEDGLERPSFVPNFCYETRVIYVKGEPVIVPQLHETLEWVLTSPMDYHTFEETPAIKEPVESKDDKDHAPAKAH